MLVIVSNASNSWDSDMYGVIGCGVEYRSTDDVKNWIKAHRSANKLTTDNDQYTFVEGNIKTLEMCDQQEVSFLCEGKEIGYFEVVDSDNHQRFYILIQQSSLYC